MLVALEVGESQKDFIETTNLRSFADSHMLNADGIPATPLAIYADDTMVGFLMYIYDTTDHESFQNEVYYGKKTYFIWQFMIDKSYQGKGYGKLAFEKMLADIETMPNGEAQYVDLFYHKSNVIAKELGVPGFAAGNYQNQARRFGEKRLKELLYKLLEMDVAAKTGEMDAEEAATLVILRYAKPQN